MAFIASKQQQKKTKKRKPNKIKQMKSKQMQQANDTHSLTHIETG